MKKMAKRVVGLALVLVCLLACIPQSHAVQTAAALPNELFLTQNYNDTCTLSSAAMMIRTAMYLHGNPNWTKVTENSLRPIAWVENVGLKWNFSHTVGDTTVKIGRYVQSGFTIQQLKAVLDTHPEGVVLYCGNLPHAVFLTGYEGDVFYCADTVNGLGGRQVTLKESWLGIKYGSQAAVLKKITAYWYITDYTENGQSLNCDCSREYAGTYVSTSSGMDLRIRAGHGTSYAILGSIPYGARVTVLRASGEGNGKWAHVYYNGISGYVSMGYLKKVPCEHQFGDWEASSVEGEEIRNCSLCNHSETRKEPNYPMGTVTGDDLCIRTGAGKNYDVKGYLQTGDRVKIMETKQVGDLVWGRISKGWICMSYVRMDEVTQEPETPIHTGTIINTNELKIRAGAGTSYAIKGYLKAGDRVEIFETKQVGSMLWGRIQQGWICMDYVKVDEAAQEPETPIHTGTIINTNELKIRAGAGTNYAIKGYMKAGDRVEIFETKQNGSMLWGRIQQGWICLDYVKMDAATQEPETPIQMGTIINTNELKIRAGAGTNYAIKGYLKAGDRVEIFETKQKGSMQWGRIQQGWICLDYVKMDAATQEPEVTTQMGTVVGASVLRIRAGAGTSYGVAGYLQEGDRVEILETKQVGSVLWGRIEKGWISLDYVKMDEVNQEPEVSTQMGTVNTSVLRIRAGAGTNYDVAGYLQEGNRVEILETKQVGSVLWGRIEQGWISLEYVDLD